MGGDERRRRVGTAGAPGLSARHVPEREPRRAPPGRRRHRRGLRATPAPRTRSGCSGGRRAGSSSRSTSPRARSPPGSASRSTATAARTSSASPPSSGTCCRSPGRFKGGRGVATGARRAARDLPVAHGRDGACCGSSLAAGHAQGVDRVARLSLIAFPIVGRARRSRRGDIVVIAVLALLVIGRHCSNLRRLVKGEELGLEPASRRSARRRRRACRDRRVASARGAKRDQGRDPRRRARHAVPARRPRASPRRCCRSSTSRRSSTSSKRRSRAGPHRHPDHHRPRQARDRGPLRPQLRARALPRAVGEARPARGGAGRSTSSPTSTTSASATRSASGTRCAWRASTWATSRSPCCSATTSWSTTASCSRSMLDVHERDGRVGARAARGRARARSRRTAAPSARSSATALVPRARRRREAASRGGAVEPRGDRPLRVHARHLRRARPHRRPASAASSSSPTRSACCSTTEPVFGRVFTDGPLRHRPEARLPPRQHRARARARTTSAPSSPTT